MPPAVNGFVHARFADEQAAVREQPAGSTESQAIQAWLASSTSKVAKAGGLIRQHARTSKVYLHLKLNEAAPSNSCYHI